MARAAQEDDRTPAVRWLEDYLSRALALGASDLHLEPNGQRLMVRVRVDGYLQALPAPPECIVDPLVTRARLLAGVDLADRRLPRDGRFCLRRDKREIDVRVAFMPVAGGEKIAFRLLDRARPAMAFEHLGFAREQAEIVRRTIEKRYGMLVVCGPTGSGKTTTLYGTIERLRRPDTSILTVEDPIECRLSGISQVSVNEAAGRSFSLTLRHALRQDPDILMIGEIRDEDSARTACRAALTGHLVLSTLHARDSTESIVRLSDMGIPDYLLRATVRLVVAQRLLRRPCTNCRRLDVPDRFEAACFSRIGRKLPRRLVHSVGCANCGGSGYRGRLAVFELLETERRDDPAASPPEGLLASALTKAAALETTVQEAVARCPEPR